MKPTENIIKSRRFLPLFITQFLGAFNDNLCKNALVILISFKLAHQVNAAVLVPLAAGLFILPFFLFSATAGQVADKFDRARIARATRLWEIFLSILGAVGFYSENITLLFSVLFCFGVQSTFFGPVKYALLPQHLREDELIAGNGYIEAGTFLAILLGTILGGILIMQPGGDHLIAVGMLSVALLGYVASRYIPPAPAPMPELAIKRNLFAATWNMISHGRDNPRVFRCIMGISWFWLVGATFLSQFPAYASQVLGANETVVTLMLAVFSIGIGTGSIFCNKLLGGIVSTRFVPWAALGISLFTFDFYLATPVALPVLGESLIGISTFMDQGGWRILADLFLVAVCGGIYIVPLYAVMQHDGDPHYLARIIATNNIVNALFMVVAAVVTMAALASGAGVMDIFLGMATLNIVAAAYIRRVRRLTQPA